MLVLCLVVSFPFLIIVCVIHVMCHAGTQRGVSPGDASDGPSEFCPINPCLGKAPAQCVVKVMFNPGAPSQILASAHSLSTNCAHGNYAATCLVGNLPSPTWRQPCGPLLLLLKSNRFLALTLYLYPAPNPPCFIGAVCPGDSEKGLGLLCWKCSLMTIFKLVCWGFFSTLWTLLLLLLTHSFCFLYSTSFVFPSQSLNIPLVVPPSSPLLQISLISPELHFSLDFPNTFSTTIFTGRLASCSISHQVTIS